MKRVGKKILDLAIAIFVVGALLVGLLYVNYLIENHRDATTTIEDAVVVSKERVKASRRNFTTFYLNIQEKGKSEETRVKVDMGTFTWCKEGSIYNDYPGSRGKCENEDFPSIEDPDYEPFVFDPPEITYPTIPPSPTP